MEDYLLGELGAKHVVCGHDFSFGYRGQGTPDKLRRLCAQRGVGVNVVDKVSLGGITVSSTHIRQLIRQGDMEAVAQMLGHRHFLSGEVLHGKELGRRLGFPTANLALPEGLIAPAYGVYATLDHPARWLRPPGGDQRGRPSHGARPAGRLVEAWILDCTAELYGETIRVEFFTRLRGEKKFDSLEALREEVLRNAAETRAFFQNRL